MKRSYQATNIPLCANITDTAAADAYVLSFDQRRPSPNQLNPCVPKKRQTNRIYHWFPMQTEKCQREGKRIIPEMRFTEPFKGSLSLLLQLSNARKNQRDRENLENDPRSCSFQLVLGSKTLILSTSW